MEANPGEDGCMRTISIWYTNPGKDPDKRSPPNITTRPIHKIAVIVPAGYMFEDNMGGGEAIPRGPRCDPGTEKNSEAAGTPGGDPAEETDVGEPKEEELQPTGRKRRGKPKRMDMPSAKKRPGRPRKKLTREYSGGRVVHSESGRSAPGI